MYTLLHKKIKGKPYSVRHYRGFPKLFLENQALLGFHEAKTGVECGSWVKGGPSLWERARVRGLVPGAARPLRRHCVGAGSAATFTPSPLPRGEGARHPACGAC